MTNNKRAREATDTIVNLVLVILIAIGLILLNFVTIAKLEDYEHAIKDAMFIQDDLQIINDENAVAEIMRYQSDSYNMIEVYNEDMDLLMSVQFGNQEEAFPVGNIKDYPELMEELQKHDSGRFIVEHTISDTRENEEISFNWLVNNQGDTRLIVIYSMMPVVEDVWVISTICYLILILVLILMLKFILHRYSDKISMYKYLSIF